MRGEIGKRASEAIRMMAKEHEEFLEFELSCLGLSRYCLYQWGRGNADPNAATLAKMLKMGYDINYILLGVRS